MDSGLVSRSVHSGLLREEWPEYRLVIPAEGPVCRQVMTLRRLWVERFGATSAPDQPPGITMASFAARPEMEETLVRWIGNLAAQQQVFAVTMNNLGALPPNVLYLRVQDDGPFQKMVPRLQAMLDLIRLSDGRRARVFEKPFIKLGKMPEPGQPVRWLAFTHRLFHADFTARQLVLMRQEKEIWKTVSQFPFREKS